MTLESEIRPNGRVVKREGSAGPRAAIVVLIHGLGRTGGCWRKMTRALEDAGFLPLSIDYPSRRLDIADLVSRCIGPSLSRVIAEASHQGRPVHIVTHSLGGILIRHWLLAKRLQSASRVVMLAPPNHGSEVIDRLARLCWFRRLMGPAALQLGASPTSWVNRLPDWTSEARLGVIAGNRSADPWFNRWFDGPHDGKVTVESTYLKGCHTVQVLPVTHTWIMDDVCVQQWVIDYLRQEGFCVRRARGQSRDL